MKTPASNRLRIIRLSRDVKMPTKCSRMAAGHDIYALEDRIIPAKGQVLVMTGIAIGLPKGTYGRRAARRGMASKNGIAVEGGVIDADYTGEVKVILRNHRNEDYQFKAGDRIAQVIVEKIQLDEAIEIGDLDEAEPGTKGFGSTDLGPKRLITTKETKITMCFLNPNPEYSKYLDDEDIETNPRLRQEVVMLSNAIIAAVHMQTQDESFLYRIRMAGKEDDSWLARKEELSRPKENDEALPKHRDMEDGLLYYKDRLFIPTNEDLLTEIAKGCHDSKVAVHFGEEKTIQLVTRNFYWEKLTDWINDYV